MGGLNDLGTALTAALSEAGKNATGVAGAAARVSPLVTVPISGYLVGNGLATGNTDETFNGSFGFATLLVTVFDPIAGAAMGVTKVVNDVAADNAPNVLEEAALAPPTATCSGKK